MSCYELHIHLTYMQIHSNGAVHSEICPQPKAIYADGRARNFEVMCAIMKYEESQRREIDDVLLSPGRVKSDASLYWMKLFPVARKLLIPQETLTHDQIINGMLTRL